MQLWDVSFDPAGGYGNGLFVVAAETPEQALALAQAEADENCYSGECHSPSPLNVKLAPDANKPGVVTYTVYIQ